MLSVGFVALGMVLVRFIVWFVVCFLGSCLKQRWVDFWEPSIPTACSFASLKLDFHQCIRASIEVLTNSLAMPSHA